jgi:hypothetical protein
MKDALYKKIENVFKANYLAENIFLTEGEIAAQIFGPLPRDARSAVIKSIRCLMAVVRDGLEEDGFLMISNVEVERLKIKGRKLARPEDADFIISELQRRAKRRNGINGSVKRAVKNINEARLLPKLMIIQDIPQLVEKPSQEASSKTPA